MSDRNPRPDEAGAFRFPWGTVLLAMAASGLLGAAIWERVATGHVWMNLLAPSVAGILYSVYALRRQAREEARLWHQRLARQAEIVARTDGSAHVAPEFKAL